MASNLTKVAVFLISHVPTAFIMSDPSCWIGDLILLSARALFSVTDGHHVTLGALLYMVKLLNLTTLWPPG